MGYHYDFGEETLFEEVKEREIKEMIEKVVGEYHRMKKITVVNLSSYKIPKEDVTIYSS